MLSSYPPHHVAKCSPAVRQPSGSALFVAVVQAADLRNGENPSAPLDLARFGCIFLQRQVRSRTMVVGKIALQDSLKVPLIQNHHVIQALPADGPDQSFSEPILPGTLRSGDDLLHAKRPHAQPEPTSTTSALATSSPAMPSLSWQYWPSDASYTRAATWPSWVRPRESPCCTITF